jgi:hypothetical protein
MVSWKVLLLVGRMAERREKLRACLKVVVRAKQMAA